MRIMVNVLIDMGAVQSIINNKKDGIVIPSFTFAIVRYNAI